jgi:ssDNA-binding Zn-finger/Zn-ribbon topoisomerase 1
METGCNIRCPRCGSDAWYRFGNTVTGKRRYICQVCSRQFIADYENKLGLAKRPCCDSCGATMHIYMRDPQKIRFRCSRYPECRGFKRLDLTTLSPALPAEVTTSAKSKERTAQQEISSI